MTKTATTSKAGFALDAPVLGCDVSKDAISCYSTALGKTVTIRNARHALRKHLKAHRDHIVIFEPTGGHESLLARTAFELGAPAARVAPRRLKDHGLIHDGSAKTDARDARVLADYGQRFKDQLRPFTPLNETQKTLQACVRQRQRFVEQRTAMKNQMQAPDNKPCRPFLRDMIAKLNRVIEKLEAKISTLIEQSDLLRGKHAILLAQPGIGAKTAMLLVANLPELGQCTRRQIASLAGLAPVAKDSGKKSGYRRTRYGRRGVKQAMYMAALSASRYNPLIKPFYDNLIQNGKPPMKALTAAARKLLTIVNAKIRDESIRKQQS